MDSVCELSLKTRLCLLGASWYPTNQIHPHIHHDKGGYLPAALSLPSSVLGYLCTCHLLQADVYEVSGPHSLELPLSIILPGELQAVIH